MEKNNTDRPCHLIEDDWQPIYNDILELVQKNKPIPNFLKQLTPNNQALLNLKKAIDQGDSLAQIWNDPDCNLYLIYLIQEKMIPFWQGITAYVYLIAKMQYTETQDLHTRDQDVKFNYQINIVFLVEAGKVTELGYQYLFGMAHALERLNVYLNFSQLVSYVFNLPRIEQWLIETEFDHHMTRRGVNHDSNRLVSILMGNLPLIQKVSAGRYDDPTTHYFVPSSSLINYCLQAMNEQPMRMRPVFGNPGLATLYSWHEQDFHPVSLYATQILSNPKEADGYRCGPFALWLHDIGHTFWASLLSKPQRDYIFKVYIPALRCLKEMAEKYHDDVSIEFLKQTEKKAYDFDLTAVIHYLDENTRFETYLAHTIGKDPFYPICLHTDGYECGAIGRAEGDTFYFLLHYCLYDAKLPEAYKEVYKTLIRFVSTGESFRNQRIVNALQRLAKNATSVSQSLFSDAFSLVKVDLWEWQTLLNSSRSSAELWMDITNNPGLALELLSMIEQGLIFFHPYLPMTDEKRRELLDCLEYQLTIGTESSKDPYSNATIKPEFQSQFFGLNSPLGFWQVPRSEDAGLSCKQDKKEVHSAVYPI